MIGRRLMVLCCLAFLASAARAQGVDLELVLAVDSSGSIDGEEFELQRVGYASALTHPDVLAAIARGPHRAIAITFVEWSGPEISTEVVPWTRITDAASAGAVAGRIVAAPRTIFGGGTALGGAIDHGMALLARNRLGLRAIARRGREADHQDRGHPRKAQGVLISVGGDLLVVLP